MRAETDRLPVPLLLAANSAAVCFSASVIVTNGVPDGDAGIAAAVLAGVAGGVPAVN